MIISYSASCVYVFEFFPKNYKLDIELCSFAILFCLSFLNCYFGLLSHDITQSLQSGVTVICQSVTKTSGGTEGLL